MFARLPGGRTLLLDSGGHGSVGTGYIEKNVIARFVNRNGYGGIDYLILTRLNQRSLGGVVLLSERLPIAVLLTPGRRLDGEVWDKIYGGELRWVDYSLGLKSLDTGKAKVAIIATQGDNWCEEYGKECPMLLKISYKNITALASSGGLSKGWLDEIARERGGLQGIIKPNLLYIPRPKDERVLSEIVSLISPELVVTEKRVGQALGAIPVRKVYAVERDGALTMVSDGESIKVTHEE
jgi:hypothetical protein